MPFEERTCGPAAWRVDGWQLAPSGSASACQLGILASYAEPDGLRGLAIFSTVDHSWAVCFQSCPWGYPGLLVPYLLRFPHMLPP